MSFSIEDRRAFYAKPAVRERILEFLGGSAGRWTAVFLAVGSDDNAGVHRALPVEELNSWLDGGCEINRSLWDRQDLICHLDLEYVNFDKPGYAYQNPERIFALQEPLLVCAMELLALYGIVPLKLMTGRGYHLVWKIAGNSKAFAALADIGKLTPSIKRIYATETSPTGESVMCPLGEAFSGLGMLMEFLGGTLKRRAAPRLEVPVELGAIEIGEGGNGREMISIDITEYADPLSSRAIRVPFSAYLKPIQQRSMIGNVLADEIEPIVVIPCADLTFSVALALRKNLSVAASFAETVSATIPDMSAGIKKLIAAYLSSALGEFHRWFYSEDHDAPGRWPETYDRTSMEMLPPCARQILLYPNDLLLRPACVQRVVRVFLSLGWHPRHIAGLIRSKYERNYGWDEQWRGNDPATRADFYARLFTGLFVTRTDDLVDFNCSSARQEGLCFVQPCGDNLLKYRKSLIDRRQYERLARRPFNRLFLPTEHS